MSSLLTTAPSAWGSVRHVDAIGGSDTGECVQASPCQTITYALGRPGSGDEIIVASGTYDVTAPIAVTEEVDMHGVAGDPRPLIRAAAGADAMTVGGAAAGSRFSHLHFRLTGGFLTGFNAAVLVTTPATFEDVEFSLTAGPGPTPDRGRAFLVDLPPDTATPVVLRGATVNANSAVSGQDGAGLVETAHGTLQVRDLVVSNVAEGVNAIAGISAGSDSQPNDAILDVDGATITTRGRCLGLFGGSAAAGSTLRNLTVSQSIDGPGGFQATVECVRIGSRYTTIDGMKVTALEGTTNATQYDDAAIEVLDADNLTLRRIDVTSVQPALYAGPPSSSLPPPGFVTSLQIHGARMQSMTNSALLIRNGTGRLTDVLAVGGSSTNNAGVRFFPESNAGNQFALRNVTAVAGNVAGTAGIFLDNGMDIQRTVTVTGRNVIARGGNADVFISPGSTLSLDHSFVATVTFGSSATYNDGGNNSTGPPGFVNEAGGDYHLTAVAAALNAGVTDSFVGTEDFEGDARSPADASPDVGADERRAATVPQTTITGAPPVSGTDPSATFHFVADDASATFTCAVTGSSPAACTSPFTSSALLPDGLYTFTVTASNTTGADPTPATFEFRVDRTRPDTAIAGSALTSDPTPAFTLSSAGEATAAFQCALDGAALAACPASYVAPALADGQHTLKARARDAAGNPDPTPVEFAFTVDTTTTTPPAGSTPPVVLPVFSPLPDRTAPKLVLTIAKARLRAALSKGLKLTVRSDEAATGTISIEIPVATVRKLKLGKKAITFARSTARISNPGSPSFTLKPRSALRRKLSRQRKLTLRVVVKVQDAAGNVATVTRKLTLKR